MNIIQGLKVAAQLPLVVLKSPPPETSLHWSPKDRRTHNEHMDRLLPTPTADIWLDKLFSTEGIPRHKLSNCTGPR